MKDYYAEHLINKYDSTSNSIAKCALILVTCFSLYGVAKNPSWIVITILLVALDIWLFWRMDVEYEYLFINDELSIDKVMAKSKRKTVFKVHMRDVELIAPVDSGEARPYQKIKIRNFSSRRSEGNVYLMIITEDDGCVGLKFEPSPEILAGMIRFDSDKVIVDSI